jgi:hypothetical protein
MYMDGVRYIEKPSTPEFVTARTNLLAKLEGVTLPKLSLGRTVMSGKNAGQHVRMRGDRIGNIGRTCTFGFGRTRTKGWTGFAANTRWPEVYKALCEYGVQIVPAGTFFNCITLNQNVQAKKHTDSLNVGDSVIVALGPYEGGKLRVYNPVTDEFIAHDIKDRPLQFNGNTHPHETEPIVGERWSIIYYCQARRDPLIYPSTGV